MRLDPRVPAQAAFDDGPEPFDRVAAAALILRCWWVVVFAWLALSIWIVLTR